MEDMPIEFRKSDERVTVTAKNGSLRFSGYGLDEDHAVRGLQESIRTHLGTLFAVEVDRTANLVRLSKIP